MRAKSTSGLPGHTPTTLDAPSDVPSAPTGAHDVSGQVPDVDPRRSAWLLIADGLVQGCPRPLAFSFGADVGRCFLSLQAAGDVVIWAAFLGLDAPSASTFPRSDDPTVLVTLTTASGPVDGLRWTVDHFHRAPAPTCGGEVVDGE